MALPFDLQHASALKILAVGFDMLVVAFIMYKAMTLFKGTQAISLVKGLAILFAANAAAEFLKLDAVHWILRQATTMALIGIPIVFQPEIRRALERLGRGRLFGTTFATIGRDELHKLVVDICRSAAHMSREKTGALIVLERETGVGDTVETGTKLDAIVSSDLILNIFTPKTPLHDGAAILRGNRIVAAGCVLPLSDAQSSGRKLGTRHRAALGISEQSDALAVVVSEETGTISLAVNGRLIRHLSETELRDKLIEKLVGGAPTQKGVQRGVTG